MHDPTTSLIAGIAVIAMAVVIWFRRIFNSPSRQIAKLMRQIQSGELPQRTKFDHEIKFTETGFTIVATSGIAVCGCDWASVRNLTAFKEDLFATDLVCLAFELSDGSVINANEEMDGWSELCDALPVHLPGAPAWNQWFMNITVPAFEPCVTPLYHADAATTTNEMPT